MLTGVRQGFFKSLVRTSGRPADDDVLAGVDDALAAALGALGAGLADDGGAAGAAEAQQAAAVLNTKY
eukprot:SAG22_NODE_51_length_24458_cov_19.853161_11_plen_68_part_00